MKQAPSRRCSDCPKRTKAVCHHAFGVFWCIKSGEGEGCEHPLDDVAEAWSMDGWTPGSGESAPIAMSVVETPNPATKSDARSKIQAEEPPPLSDSDY